MISESKYEELSKKLDKILNAVHIQTILQNPLSIGDIENASESLQILAVSRDPSSISRIPSPSEKVQLAAVMKAKSSVMYIKNPTNKVIEYVNIPRSLEFKMDKNCRG